MYIYIYICICLFPPMKSSHNPPQRQQSREYGGAHGKFHSSGLQGEFHHG